MAAIATALSRAFVANIKSSMLPNARSFATSCFPSDSRSMFAISSRVFPLSFMLLNRIAILREFLLSTIDTVLAKASASTAATKCSAVFDISRLVRFLYSPPCSRYKLANCICVRRPWLKNFASTAKGECIKSGFKYMRNPSAVDEN